MARKKKEIDSSKDEKDEVTHRDFGHEIWGLIYLSIGVLTFIALISHFFAPDNNILGKYFGTAMATGLIYLFGKVACFVVPLAICIIGWVRLKGEEIRVQSMLFWGVITVEFCIITAIHHLPKIVTVPKFAVDTNNFGLFFVKFLFAPLFGTHRFGPYFLIGLLFTVTILAGFKIPPQRLFSFLIQNLKKLYESLSHAFTQAFQTKAIEPKNKDIVQSSEEISEDEKEEKKNKVSKNLQSKVDEPIVQNTPEIDEKENPKTDLHKAEASLLGAALANQIDGNTAVAQSENSAISSEQNSEILDAEEEAKRRLDEELAAFRAKKNEPIQIMSIETAEDLPELDEEEQETALMEMNQEADDTVAMQETAIVEIEDEFTEGDQEEAETKIIQKPLKPYEIPGPDTIPDPPQLASMIDREAIEKNSMILEKTLMNFGVEGKVIFVSPGPVVTRYEIELAPGIKVSRVVSLHDDISMAVGGQRIRIEAPIPGKSAVGIELPNAERQIVYFKHILTSDAFKKSKAKLPVVIGTNVSGAPYVTDITKMPHVLIAGQTGSGKSVCINSIICTLLMTKKPEELRLIMIDPKKVELAFYEGIPHLLSPVVTESKEAVKALQWGVLEMERRYRMLAKVGARHIDSFNTRVESGKLGGILLESDNKPLPFIVIIVDELADLMMTASKDVEGLIQRIAQLARAVGIHLIVATQRPSVDIITGPIKANLTSRISFRTIQNTDSRTILGHVGAEKLLGMGDMLFLRNGAPEIERFHGAFISEEDVEKIVAEVRKQQVDIEKIESFHEATESDPESDSFIPSDGERDELFEEAARIIVGIGQGSTSMLQRRMKIGYARAGRLMDELERTGFVGPPDGSKAREVLVRPDELDEILSRMR